MLNINNAINSLVEQGWYKQEGFISHSKVKQLADICKGRTLKKASIGNGELKTINKSIRSDNISWIEDDEKETFVLNYIDQINMFSQTLNRELYLGINGFECHFAQYLKGSFYKAHKDSFKNDDKRTITMITYLNENWKEGDGGELRLHLPTGNIDIKPYGGTFICFRSSEIVHEVLESNKERLSITGWLLK